MVQHLTKPLPLPSDEGSVAFPPDPYVNLFFKTDIAFGKILFLVSSRLEIKHPLHRNIKIEKSISVWDFFVS